MAGGWPLSDDLASAATLRQAAGLLESAVAQRLGLAGSPDPVVEAAVTDWAARGRRLSPALVAHHSGLTPRQVHRRFVAAVGYGPKLLQRILRFQSFLSAAVSEPDRRLGELAHEAGYADQSHLNRDSAALAKSTPAELRRARHRDVRNVQDEAPPS